MPEIISAVYEGNGMVRLSQELEGVNPQDRLTLLVIPVGARKELSIETVGLDGLRQQIQAFEARYSLETSEFHTRFLRGELGDERDFIVWAGLHDLLQRMTSYSQPSVVDD